MRFNRFAVVMATLCALSMTTYAAAQSRSKTTKPAAGSPHEALLGGLKLIVDKKFDAFLDRYCHQEDLCYTDRARKSLLRYNLPALSRIGGQCIKAGDTLKVTRTDGDPAKDATVKIFVECNPKGMPRPFTLKKEGGQWKWKKV